MQMELDRRGAIGLALALSASGASAFSEPADTIRLWPNGAPDAPAKLPVEVVTERGKADFRDRAVSGISDPRLVVFRAANPTGAAMLICPGGGYKHVVVDKEGFELGNWLAARGITAFVLFYRLPADGWSRRSDTPLIDAQRAMRLIRSRAAEFGVDPVRLGVMGFSAGGHLAADLAARFAFAARPISDTVDRLSARPFLAAPIYPVISMTAPMAHAGSRDLLIGKEAGPELERAHNPAAHIPADAPPHFLCHAEDDGAVPVANTLLLREALVARGIVTETHLFPTGGHGFGLRQVVGTPTAEWPNLFLAFARARGLFGSS
ncbi:alpha/beta hydrolase [Sandaracinobacteroides hominis]|uniref:alpha/beta hydrolase n=1 Tax=Sandaracinobacteroides hominis TaxID=2780086 RepID=UPI001F3AF05F|nr:alpha/beta hydrolase [Sandaracinobacteroides hominis]